MTWQYWSVWSEDVIMVFALVDLSVDSVDHDPHQSLDDPGGWTCVVLILWIQTNIARFVRLVHFNSTSDVCWIVNLMFNLTIN